MKFAYSVLIFLFSVNVLSAQTPPPNKDNFLLSLKSFQKQQIEIRKLLNSIQIQELNVNYAWGKQIDQYKDLAASQLDLLSQSTLSPSIGDDLAEEMFLLDEAQELNAAMTQLSNFLSDPGITHDATSTGKANTWARSVTAANTKLSGFSNDAFHYIVWHARDVQTTKCVSK